MTTNALHVTFLWEAFKPDERTNKVYTDLEVSTLIVNYSIFGHMTSSHVQMWTNKVYTDLEIF